MRRSVPAFILILLGVVSLPALATAQGFVRLPAALAAAGLGVDGAPALNIVAGSHHDAGSLLTAVTLPRMAPELALQVFQNHAILQDVQLGAYSAVSTVTAVLPDLSEKGVFELDRRYLAPNTLQFTPVSFTGDGFVKSNVIVRLLQSEVDHVQKDQPAQTAINNRNYKFAYKGTERLNGRLVHVFHVKPRKKRPGLFKGRIFVDVYSGTLVRAEGRIVKSPSIFIKDIDFQQDYADIDGFTFPVHMHSQAKARIIGRVVVDVAHRNYQTMHASVEAARVSPGAAPASN